MPDRGGYHASGDEKTAASGDEAEAIGMRFVCEYSDEINGKTHVSMISREEWLAETK